MKKIIAAFDSLKLSASTRDYSIQPAKQNSAILAGVFLEDHSGYKTYDLLYERGSLTGCCKDVSYTRPALKPFLAEVIAVKDPKQSSQLTENMLMKEFIKKYFPKASYTV